jgi:hypothetical protein
VKYLIFELHITVRKHIQESCPVYLKKRLNFLNDKTTSVNLPSLMKFVVR